MNASDTFIHTHDAMLRSGFFRTDRDGRKVCGIRRSICNTAHRQQLAYNQLPQPTNVPFAGDDYDKLHMFWQGMKGLGFPYNFPKIECSWAHKKIHLIQENNICFLCA